MINTSFNFQKIDFDNNNHSIIYAPNSTGKTRLTNKLAKKYVEEQAMFFTSAQIDDMLSFSGRKIYVGSDSSFKLENENIVKEYNKSSYGAYLLKEYDAKNASELVKNSCLFNTISLKRKDAFEIYSKLFDFINGDRSHHTKFSFFEMVQIDKALSKLELESIKNITSNNINLLIDNSDNSITKELKEKLQSIFDSINSSKRICPLCGHEFETNRELKMAINKMLNSYMISADVHDYEICVDFLNVLDKINAHLNINYFETNYDYEISTKLLIDNLSIIGDFLIEFASFIINQIDGEISNELFLRYKSNKIIIEKEDNSRRSSAGFCSAVVKTLNELIMLPDGFKFREKDDKVEIIDESGKIVDPKVFLSESEKRRMCISIVFAEVEQRQLQYVVFDDPVDSNDDYYFDISVNVIGDLLLENQTLNWIILTHEFRMVSILSERCRLSANEFSKNIGFLFYLPDPSFNGSNVPPFHLIDTKADSLSFLNEHETIIFKKIFIGVPGYQCDKELALLPSFNAARNLYNDILKSHKISKHKTMALIHTIATGNKSYEHYKSGGKRIMRLSTLYIMNKLMYESINPSYYTNSRAYASNYRNSYILTKSYHSIHCDSDVLKYILFAMIRVMNCHYLFEKKLAEWAALNVSLFNFSDFENAQMIYNKIKYVDSICPASKKIDLQSFITCFIKWRGLLNDFSHSASRMVPPYLTISPMEMFKLESSIKLLP